MTAEVFPRDRPNPPDLVAFDDARDDVLARARPLDPVPLALEDALGCVLAEDVAAAEDQPPFDNSAMDGFALRAEDVGHATAEQPTILRISGEVFAGSAALPTVAAGEAARIMTGGPVPPGADVVVPIEQLGVEGERVVVGSAFERGAFIRRAGEDVRAGDVVLRKRAVLSPAALGMLAASGHDRVLAHPRPRVAVVATGDELVDPGDKLGPGQIRDSNSTLLSALSLAAGARTASRRRLRDDPDELRTGFDDAVRSADLVLTSGGVSVGDRDYTKQVLAELGDVRSRRVAMQPGMPQAFGLIGGTPLFGLPGNPVSCFVVFEVLVRPLLRRLAGHADDQLDRPRVVARLSGAVRSPAGKVSFLRVRLAVGDAGIRAELTGAQGSNILSSTVAADGLAVIPADVRELPAGAEVSVIVVRDDLGWVV